MGAMAPALIASEIFGHERGAFTGAQDSRPGMFEQAHGGTVFLDEIATMDEKTQVSLLRVLEEKTVRRVGGAKNMGVDVRVIAASNEDLEKRVAIKAFRTVADSLTAIEHARREPLDTAVLVSTGSLVNVADTVFNLRDLNRSMEIIILVNRLGPRSGRFLRTLLDHPIERTRVLTRRQLQRELTASCARQYRRTPR
jgi:hypothetical protein